MKNVFLLSSVLFSLGLSFSLFASQDKLETQYQSLVELFLMLRALVTMKWLKPLYRKVSRLISATMKVTPR